MIHIAHDEADSPVDLKDGLFSVAYHVGSSGYPVEYLTAKKWTLGGKLVLLLQKEYDYRSPYGERIHGMDSMLFPADIYDMPADVETFCDMWAYGRDGRLVDGRTLRHLKAV